VCLQHCTPLYVATVIARSKLAKQCFTAEELADACTLTTAAHCKQGGLLRALAKSGALASWSSKRRPASAMQQLELQLEVPIEALMQEVEAHLEGAKCSTAIASSGVKTWQGEQMQLALALHTTWTTSGSPTKYVPNELLLGVLLFDGPVAAVRQVTYRVRFNAAVASDLRRGAPVPTDSGIMTQTVNGDSIANGIPVPFGHVKTWAAVEAKLCALGLLRRNSSLRLTACVTKIE
jgi:hypothetical protein